MKVITGREELNNMKNSQKIKYETKTNLDSMRISSDRLSQFITLFYGRTGTKLSEAQALARAEILLRTISILYQPVSTSDYYSALARKLFLKTRKV